MLSHGALEPSGPMPVQDEAGWFPLRHHPVDKRVHPIERFINTLPAQIAPLEISKKNPLVQPWTQLLTNTPSVLPTSYQMPLELGLSITRLFRQVTR